MQYTPLPIGHWLHAFDLGKRKVGIASALVLPGEKRASLVHFVQTVEWYDQKPWSANAMAEKIGDYLDQFIGSVPEVLVCEWPKKYDKKRSAHKDLDSLHAVGDAIAKQRQRRWEKKYSPASWKGNVPKNIYWPRAKRALSESEMLALVDWLSLQGRDKTWLESPAAHDAQDALGICLFALGRLKRGGVLP